MKTCIDRTKVVILVDNKANEGLEAEHGFSVWVEAADRRLLFDTGQGAALASNLGRLNLAMNLADTLILSHGHYDHTGGVPLVIENAPAVQVYCHPAARSSRYSVHLGGPRQIGMPETTRWALEKLPAGRLHWITQPVELAPGIGLTGPIPRLTDYEDVGGPFFVDAEGEYGDQIEDDQALWIRTELGLVVLVGCCHSGLINTLHYVRRLSGTPKIHAVIGGFHLTESKWTRIDRTIAALNEINPELIVPCHCTGERVAEQLAQALGRRVQLGSAGETYMFDSAKGTS